MAASIKIDQATLTPAGAADRSRSDGLAGGQVVTLTSTAPGASNTWALLWVPDGDTTAVASLVASGVTSTFTPTAGVYGTYRIQLTVDGVKSIRTFAIRTPNRGLRVPALNERADTSASLINHGAAVLAASESNEPDSTTGSPFNAGDYAGYYSALRQVIDTLDAHAHAMSDITGLVAALAGKAASVHTHAESDVTGLVSDLATLASSISSLSTSLSSLSSTVSGLPATTAPADVTKAAATVGVSPTLARADHKHDISTGTPSTLGTANAEGTSTSLARQDHVHDHGAQSSGTLHAAATTSTAGFMSAADKTFLGHFSAGAGTPNGSVTGSPGDLYLNTSGGAGISLWIKESGSATNTGWIPNMVVHRDTTANRPATPTVGTPYLDSSQGIPIWYDGTNWINAAGVPV